MLSEVKESIINAYEVKTGLKRSEISKMMDNETWMSAKKAVELGFADEVLYEKLVEDTHISNDFIFDRVTVVNTLISKFPKKKEENQTETQVETQVGTSYKELSKRLDLIK